jgi:uncharacterized protein (DUF433 family)
MAATAAETFQNRHIVKTPGVRGGKARIDGTRICVVDLVHLLKRGLGPDEMRSYYSDRQLTLAEVHSALAYYYDNVDEIEAEIAAEERFYADADRRWEELVSRHGGQPPQNPTAAERAIPRPFPWPPER